MRGASVLVIGESAQLLRSIRRALFSAGAKAICTSFDPVALEQKLESKHDIYIVDGDADAERLKPALRVLGVRVLPARMLLLTRRYEEEVSHWVLSGSANNTLAKTGALSVSRERIDETELIMTCRKIVSGRVFGLHRSVRGTLVPIHRFKLERSGHRNGALEQLEGFLEKLELGRSLVAAIMTVADELVMNAIFNAPLDSKGAPKYKARPRGEDFALEPSEHVQMRYCCDGQYVYLSVEDPHGSLDRGTIMKYIGSGLLKQKGHMEEKAYGAGLGLFMIFSSINQLIFNVDRGQRCEIIAGFYIREGLRGFREAGQSLNFFITEP